MIFEKIKKVLTNPDQFFTEIKSEVGVGSAFKYLAVISLVYVFIMMIFMFFFSLIIGASYSYMMGYGIFPLSLFSGIFVFVIPIAIYLICLIFSFIGAGLIHLLVRMLGGKNDYSATYKAAVYSSTPALLLGWIPYINILISLYSVYLYIKGLSILHEISMGRALLVILIPIIIVFVVFFAFVFIYLMSVFTPTAYYSVIETDTGKTRSTIPYTSPKCTNHADCSQTCSSLCPSDKYGCCVNGNIGQCNLDTGICFCSLDVAFCKACPACDYSYQYCDGFSNTCKTKLVSSQGLTGSFKLIISKLPFYPKM